MYFGECNNCMLFQKRPFYAFKEFSSNSRQISPTARKMKSLLHFVSPSPPCSVLSMIYIAREFQDIAPKPCNWRLTGSDNLMKSWEGFTR